MYFRKKHTRGEFDVTKRSMRRRRKQRYKKVEYYKGRNLRKEQTGDRIPKRVMLLLLLPLSIGITILCKQNVWIAEEIFAKRIYKWISICYSLITSVIPVSIAEFIYLLVPILVVFFLIRFLVRLVLGKDDRLTMAGRFLLNVACTASVLLFTYTILCGVNYYRYSFTYYSGLTVQDSSVLELYELCKSLAEQANDLREQVPKTDEQGVFHLTTTKRETAKKARDAMQNLSEQYPILAGWSAIPKSVLLSHYMSYTEITGVFFPFTMEANVNTDVPDFSIPYTMCHELSHMRGFMREDEANFLAYLACINYDDVEFQYCGTMLALIHAGNALANQDSALYYELRSTYSEGVLKDLVANNEYWSKFEDTVISTVSNQVNDTYLKANNQTDGVQSYGRMVDLLLALWRKK